MSKLATLQHTLGVDEYGQGVQYRNYFCCGEGHDNWVDCVELVVAGLMVRRASGVLSHGDFYFHATDAGKIWMAEHSPTPPKLSPSQRRYQRYLEAESSLTFGEWIRWQHASSRRVA